MLGGWRKLKHKPSKSNLQKASGAKDYLLGELGYTREQQEQKKELIEKVDELKKVNASSIAIKFLQKKIRDIQPEKRDPPPTIIKGDPELVGRIINGLDFDRKYEAFVWSHAKEDNEKIKKHPEILTESIRLFEEVAFAGIKEEARPIYWVGHLHTGRHEQHCIIPRVHLPTGRSFNPCPPGSESDFDAVRDVINLRYNLADPNDPARVKTIKTKPNDPNRNIKQTIHKVVEANVLSGVITNSGQVIELLKASNFKISRSGKDGLSVIPPGKQKAFKLKGAFYDQSFKNSREFGKRISAYAEERKSGRAGLLRTVEKRLERVIERRAEFVNRHYEQAKTSSDKSYEMNKPDNSGTAQVFNTADNTAKENHRSSEPENQTNEIVNASQPNIVSFSYSSTGYINADSGELTGTAIDVESWMGYIQKRDLVDAKKQLSELKKQHRRNKHLYVKLQQSMALIIKIIWSNKNDRVRTAIINTTEQAARLVAAAIGTTQPKFGRLETTSKRERRGEHELGIRTTAAKERIPGRSCELAKDTSSDTRNSRSKINRVARFSSAVTDRVRKIRTQNEQLSTASNMLKKANNKAGKAIRNSENAIRDTHKFITPRVIHRFAESSADDQLELSIDFKPDQVSKEDNSQKHTRLKPVRSDANTLEIK